MRDGTRKTAKPAPGVSVQQLHFRDRYLRERLAAGVSGVIDEAQQTYLLYLSSEDDSFSRREWNFFSPRERARRAKEARRYYLKSIREARREASRLPLAATALSIHAGQVGSTVFTAHPDWSKQRILTATFFPAFPDGAKMHERRQRQLYCGIRAFDPTKRQVVLTVIPAAQTKLIETVFRGYRKWAFAEG